MSRKRYYWIKLSNSFFTNGKIKKLRMISGGDTYVIIYLKLFMLSLETEGKLYFEGFDEDISREISIIIDEKYENVSITMSYLIKQGLINVVVQDKEFYLSEFNNMTGSESGSARRVRKYRERKKSVESPKNLQLPHVPYNEIIQYLNEKINSNYRYDSVLSIENINERYKEGYKLEDFKKVIDVKTKEWLNNEMEKYLRPQTLFGKNFESYLSQGTKEELKNELKSDEFDYDSLVKWELKK